MEAARRRPPGRACDEARLRASLALDGALDEVGEIHLRRHLRSCAACAQVVAEMGATSALMRRAPLARFRGDLTAAQLVRTCTSGLGRVWAGAGVAVAALVLATGALPRPHDAAAPPPPAAGAAVAPLELPIGQRSAMDDFAASAVSSPRDSS
jgi:Putative zinc-finger